MSALVSVPNLIETENMIPANINCKGIGDIDAFSLGAELRSPPCFPKVAKKSSQEKFKFQLERELNAYWVFCDLSSASQLMTVVTMRPESKGMTVSSPFPS